MENVFALNTADNYLSKESYRIICMCSNKEEAIKIAKLHAKNNEEKLTKEQEDFLFSQDQTQGREENFVIEEFIINAYFG
jgi:hypothetical protein